MVVHGEEEEEDERGRGQKKRRACRRRVKRAKTGKENNKDWVSIKQDAEIRGLLSSDSSEAEDKHHGEPYELARYPGAPTREGDGPTIDELLEGSMIEEDRTSCNSEGHREERD